MTDYSDVNVIYSDPAWTWTSYSPKGRGRSASAHYDTMTVQDICDIPVRDWGHSGTALLMWATDPLLPEALKVMEAWNFKYTSIAFYWAKLNKSYNAEETDGLMSQSDFFMSTGYYTRANCEMCLLGTRKKKPKRLNRNVRKLIISPRREHSRKPTEAYERIERLFEGPYLEMFSRETRPGWTAWGNETGLFDQGSVQTRRLPSSLVGYTLEQ